MEGLHVGCGLSRAVHNVIIIGDIYFGKINTSFKKLTNLVVALISFNYLSN